MEMEEALRRAQASVLDGDEEAAETVAREALAAGLSPLRVIVEGFSPAMTRVGEMFANEEYGLPEVVCAAEAMKSAMAVLEPAIRESHETVHRLATVVIGTAPGDIHDIGKHIVATMLSVNGFEVVDLGKDVPIDEFVKSARELDAGVVACSAMMTTTMVGQRDLVEALKTAGLRDAVRVVVGGSTTSQSWADRVGADGWAENANDAVGMVKELVEARATLTA